jgi:hypothetical protein
MYKDKNTRNDYILREAERIIDDYIRENGLIRLKENGRIRRWKGFDRTARVNLLINCLLMAAIAFLLFTIGRVF